MAKANVFKAKREELGITQQRAATALGIAIATWCRWENGTSKPLPEHLRLLDLLSYLVSPIESPQACKQGDAMSINTDAFESHVRTCKQCQLRVEYLHHEMDWE